MARRGGEEGGRGGDCFDSDWGGRRSEALRVEALVFNGYFKRGWEEGWEGGRGGTTLRWMLQPLCAKRLMGSASGEEGEAKVMQRGILKPLVLHSCCFL